MNRPGIATRWIAASLALMTLSFASPVSAKVEWASKVLGMSSERGQLRYAAIQALGKPNVLPNNYDSPCAWEPAISRTNGSKTEWLKVGFAKPMRIQQVAIAECKMPGLVERVVVYDTKKQEHEIYSGVTEVMQSAPHMMHVICETTPYEVTAVKIELDVTGMSIMPQIDAIGISDSSEPIQAQIHLASDVKVGPREHLGYGINSTAAEVYPVISPDGKTLFIDRKKHPENIGPSDNIWYVKRFPNGEWGSARNIGPPLNVGTCAFVSSISPDGNTMLVGGGNMGLSHRLGELPGGIERWSPIEPMKMQDLYNRDTTGEECMSSDGKEILLSLDRDDTYGGKDIYVSFLNDDGTWTKPLNIGPEVNTAASEGMPFLAADNKTLYFATDGLPGYGWLDIFLTRRLDDTWQHWSEPENLGPGINTAGWDAYYTVQASGEYAYFVSNQGGNGGSIDVFRAKLPEAMRPGAVVLVTGRVLDAKTKKPIEAQIKYESLKSKKEVGTARSTPISGDYTISLSAGDNYGYRAEAPGYISVNENLDLSDALKYSEKTVDLLLVPVEVGETARINNIFFETGKAELKDASFAELNRLIAVLASKPNIEIMIGGHTDNVGTDPANLTLSEQRANAVRTYLINKGIKPNRITAKGYGRTKPVATNDTDEGRQQNRRVEFTIEKK